jgi:hypothetical protein
VFPRSTPRRGTPCSGGRSRNRRALARGKRRPLRNSVVDLYREFVPVTRLEGTTSFHAKPGVSALIRVEYLLSPEQ